MCLERSLHCFSFSDFKELNARNKGVVFWPCIFYTVHISKKKNEEVNIFQETILKLINIGISNSQDISDLLCIDKEIIEFSIRQLIQKGFLDKNKKIVVDKYEFLESFKKENDETSLEFDTYYIYKDEVSEKILPFITNQRCKTVKKSENGYLTGSVGKIFEIKGVEIPGLEDDFQDKNFPKSLDVIEILKEMRLSKINSLNLYYQNEKRYEPNAQENLDDLIEDYSNRSIKVDQNTERVYLSCFYEISPDGRELVVNDPFINGSNSKELSFSINQINFNLQKELIDKLDKNTALNRTLKDANKSMDYLYPEVSKKLQEATACFSNLLSNDNPRVKSENYKNFSIRLNQSLENLLKLIIIKCKLGNKVDIIDILGEMGSELRSNILIKIAQQLKFNIKHVNQLFSSEKRKIMECCSGQPDLRTLICVNLYLSNQMDNHPFILLGERIPKLFEYFNELRLSRNSYAHGESNEEIFNIEPKLLQNQLDAVKNTFRLWLENTQKLDIKKVEELFNEIDACRNQENIEKLYKSRLILEFGKSLNNLSDDLYKKLYAAEKSFNDEGINSSNELSSDREISVTPIVDLASFCQQLFVFLKQTSSRGIDESKEIFKKNAKDFGFKGVDKEIPDSINLVKKDNIEKSLKFKDSKTSLGAEFFAFFISIEESKLKELGTLIPTLVLDVSELLTLRGHGINDISLVKASICRKRIYEDLKEIFKVFGI